MNPIFLSVNILLLIILPIGAWVCRKGVKQDKIIYRYAYWFFVILFIAQILSFLPTILAQILMNNRIAGRLEMDAIQIGRYISLSSLPGLFIGIAAYITLILGFAKSLKADQD